VNEHFVPSDNKREANLAGWASGKFPIKGNEGRRVILRECGSGDSQLNSSNGSTSESAGSLQLLPRVRIRGKNPKEEQPKKKAKQNKKIIAALLSAQPATSATENHPSSIPDSNQ